MNPDSPLDVPLACRVPRGLHCDADADAPRRSAGSRWVPHVLAALLMAVASVGCFETAGGAPGTAPAMPSTTNTLRAGAGWVEFFTEDATTLTTALDVYQVVEDGREAHIAQVASWRDRAAGRIETSPGEHLYTVRRGTLVRPVRVVVEPGMVTPVRVFVSSRPRDERVGIGATEPFEVQVEVLPAEAPRASPHSSDDERAP